MNITLTSSSVRRLSYPLSILGLIQQKTPKLKSFLGLCLIAIFTMWAHAIQAQAPSIQWQKLLGGNGDDRLATGLKTPDGGYLMAGSTYSTNNGDVGTNHGGNDIWVVKTDSLGRLQWQKTLGGNLNEYVYSVEGTNDGGYILVGSTNSSNNGDVGPNNGTNGTNTSDVWVVKLDAAGNIVWQRLYGGTGSEGTASFKKTTDGGYILLASSIYSNGTGDVGSSRGRNDIWLFKLDALGNVLWQKVLGSSLDDYPYAIITTTDGGYLVSATTSANGEGDVSLGNHGLGDIWLIKLDASGTTQWQKLYGGAGYDTASDITKTDDGGYIFTGTVGSNNTGDVGLNHGEQDIWVVKVNNLGNIQWQKLYGGDKTDGIYLIKPTSDGGYILDGVTYSSNNGDVGENHGIYSDIWLVKIDRNGSLLWQKVIGGEREESSRSVVSTEDGGYILGGTTNSSNNGDVGQSRGFADFWLVKLGANTPPPPPTPTVNCPSTSQSPWNEWIKEVRLGTFINASDKIRNDRYAVGYSDFTDKIISVNKGQTYPLSISNGLSWLGAQVNLFYRVWIDYNKNNIFEDVEKVFESNSVGSITANGSIAIPTTATVGTTRMRVSMKKDAYSTACETFAAGEVEDYSVQIADGIVIDPCATDVTAPVFSFCPQSMTINTTNTGCFEFSFTPPSVADNCTTTPSVNYALKRGSSVINRTPTTPAQLIIGTWRNTSSYKKTLDGNGNVVSSILIATAPQAFSELRQNGTYTTSTSLGTWELSPDGTKSIYDKGTPDERYYTNIQLTTTQFKVLGPYRLNGQLYFANTLYEYWTEKTQPNVWVTICSPTLTDTVVYTATDTRGNTSTCRFSVTVTPPSTGGGDICTNPTASVTTAANTITVAGINTSAAVIQVFTTAWTPVFNQQVSGTSVTIPNIAAGTYIVKVSKLGAGGTWPAVCTVQINNVVVGAGTDPCATDVTAPTFSFCPQSMSVNTTNTGCFEFSFTPPSVSDNCAATPSVNYALKRGSAVINRMPTTPAQLIIGTWRNTSSYRKSVDVNGNVVSSTLIATAPQAFSELRQNGTYTTSTSSGTWELSPDGTKSIYDKGTADERYYTNIQLTTTQFKVLGPYRLNGQLYFASTLYEYWTEKPQPNVWVNICAPILTDTVVYTATDTRGNTSTCRFSVTVTPPSTGGGTNDIGLSITSTPSTYRQWTPITARVSAKNNGTTAMTNVKIELKRPTKTANGGTKTPSVGTFSDYCPGGIECSEWLIPSLAAGATATLDAPFFVLDATLPIVVTANLLASTPTDATTANNTASISIAPQTAATAPAIAQLAYQKPTQLIPIVVQHLAPNPTAGELIIKLESLDEREVTFEFFNTLGKLVKTEKRAVDKGVNRVEFDVYDLEQGIHFIVPSTTQGNKVPTKFVKM